MSNQASLGDISNSGTESDSSSESDKHEEWKEEKLGDLAVYQNGNSFSKSQWSDEGYPIIRIQNLTGEQDEYNHFDGDLDEKYKVEDGDILLAWSGTIDLFQWEGEDAALNQHIYRVDTEDRINDIFFQFKLEEVIPRLIALSHGSTMKHVRKADLVNLDVEIPSDIDEQRRIASVLYNVDQAIQKTEEIIEQTQRVKKGLMQDLFTEGYYSHEEYKQENMGPQELEIPESWEIEKYRDVCRDTSVGVVVKPSKYYDDSGDIPLLRSANIKAGKIIDKDMMYTTEEKNKEIEKSQVSAGDILTVRSGYPGTSAVVEEDFEGANCVDLLISKTNEKMVPQFAAEYLNSYLGKKQVARFQNGLAQKHLNLGSLEKIDIVVPPIEEQRKIVEVLESADEEILNQEEQKEQLQRLKKGLMQDLLTGGVRTGEDVRVLDEVVEVEG